MFNLKILKMVHDLKIFPKHFSAVIAGDKRCEIRNNDRDYHTGDILVLNEWDGHYTGNSIQVLVRHIVDEGFSGLSKGFVALSFEIV